MSDLTRLVALGEQLVSRRAELEALEEQVKHFKAGVLQLEREDIPMLMAEIGVNQVTLTSGQTITLKEDCDARISDANKPAAFGWLLKNGFGGIIKTAVSVAFGRGDRETAAKITEELRDRYPERTVEMEEVVHPQTLKAFVKERMAAGDAIPVDLFGVYVYNKAVSKG
jgi:hypothetical protein